MSNLNVLIINGSPHPHGNTSIALMVHGREQGEASEDAEGLQTMRTLARNMSFLIKSIALGKERFGLPKLEPWQPTHFIR